MSGTGGALAIGDVSVFLSFDLCEVVKLGREERPTDCARTSLVCSLYFWKASD